MARLDNQQRVHIERVKRARSLSITINDGDELTLEFRGDKKKLCHEIALAIQSYFRDENDRIIKSLLAHQS